MMPDRSITGREAKIFNTLRESLNWYCDCPKTVRVLNIVQELLACTDDAPTFDEAKAVLVYEDHVAKETEQARAAAAQAAQAEMLRTTTVEDLLSGEELRIELGHTE